MGKLRSIFNKSVLIHMLWFFCLGVSITILLIDNSTAQSNTLPNPPLELIPDRVIIQECMGGTVTRFVSKYYIIDGKVQVIVYYVPCSEA